MYSSARVLPPSKVKAFTPGSTSAFTRRYDAKENTPAIKSPTVMKPLPVLSNSSAMNGEEYFPSLA